MILEASYVVDEVRGLVVATMVGECDVPVRKEVIARIAEDQSAKGLNWLVDMRRCTYVLSATEIQDEHAFIMARFQDLKIAIVVQVDVQFGMTRMGASIPEAGSNLFRPFWDLNAAIDWLQCPMD